MRNVSIFTLGILTLAIPSLTNAAIVPTIGFNSATDYTGQFVETLNAANIDYDAATASVKYDPIGANGASLIRYDTNPANATSEPADFLTETLSVDAFYSTFGATPNGSIGLLTRVQSNNKGILALLNVTGTTAVRLRLFYAAEMLSTVAGTAFYESTFNLSTGGVTNVTGTGGTGSTNAVAVDAPLTLTLAQSAAIDPIFNLTLSDANGFVASTGNQAFTVNDDYNTPGSAGLRLSLGQIGNTIRIDNFAATAVPEPGSIAIALSAGGLLLARRRRGSTTRHAGRSAAGGRVSSGGPG